MCFFFILGVVPRERKIGTETRFCRYDGRETAHEIIERRMWFTLFFIPLFPVSGRQVTARCASCGLSASEQARFEPRAPYSERVGVDVCPSCGGDAVSGARFCHYCGHPL